MKFKPTKVPVMKPNQLYEDWRKELQIWKATNTALGIKSIVQAGCLFQALEGLPRQTVLSELTVEQISCNDGVQNIIETLDIFYCGNEIQMAFNAIDDLMHFKCTSDLSMEHFMVLFQNKVNRVKSTGTVLSDGILGYALLKAANLSDLKHDLVKATCEKLTYENVKKQLKRIGLRKFNKDQPESAYDQNTESFHTAQNNFFDQPGRFRMNLGVNNRYMRQHHHRQCMNYPYASSSSKTGDIFDIYLYNGVENFVCETLSNAVIDSRCRRTVTGSIWFQSYIDSLSRNDRSSVQITKSQNKFRFGNGTLFSSKSCAVIPVYVGTSKFKIKVDIINCNMPLLLAQDTLQRANAKINKTQQQPFSLV